MFTHFMSAWLKKRPLSTWCALCFKSYLFSMFFSSKDPDSSFVIYIIFRLKLITYLLNSQHLPLTFLIKRKRMNTFFIRWIWKYLHLKSTRVPQGNILGPYGGRSSSQILPVWPVCKLSYAWLSMAWLRMSVAPGQSWLFNHY